MIERTTNPEFIAALLNDSEIRPFVAVDDGHIVDIEKMVRNPANVCLQGKHGAIICIKYFEGCYEAHAAVRTPGRGEWAHLFAESCARFMFCSTDAVELLTQVPKGHIASKALAEIIGFRPFYQRPQCRFQSGVVQSTIYSLLLQDWGRRGDDKLEAGRTFIQQIEQQGGRIEDPTEDHARALAVMVEMLLNDQVLKALFWYQRFALALRVPGIQIVNEVPLTFSFAGGLLHVANGQFAFERAH